MYNNYQQQTYRPAYQQVAMPYMGLKGRPVASIEEARGSIIDFDGSIFYFPDLANKRIYTKQINMDGTATLSVYELQEMPVAQEQVFVTREEFEAAILALRQMQTIPPEPQKATEAPVETPPKSGVVLNF